MTASGFRNHSRGNNSLFFGALDSWLVILVFILVSLGLLMVFSADSASSQPLRTFTRQTVYVAIGLIIMFIVAFAPKDLLYKLRYPALILSLVLLVATILVGAKIKGAQRWIFIGSFSLQPMELAKVSLAVYLGYFFGTKQEIVKTFSRGIIPPFVITGLFCLLLLKQPDFGAAALITCILFFLCFVGGTRFIYLFASGVLAACAGYLLIISEPYRLRRIVAFLDPLSDPLDTGYQVIQSLMAWGLGGWWGTGLNAGKQKLSYLTQANTDFIMSVLAEELGFIGVSVILILFMLFFWRCFLIAWKQPLLHDRLIVFGLTLVLLLGVVFNLAMSMGAAPPKGIAMPFFSYGGSNMVATLLCTGLILNFSRFTK